jgi:predicted RNase H-like nuclease (RuvC/YqgF family)
MSMNFETAIQDRDETIQELRGQIRDLAKEISKLRGQNKELKFRRFEAFGEVNVEKSDGMDIDNDNQNHCAVDNTEYNIKGSTEYGDVIKKDGDDGVYKIGCGNVYNSKVNAEVRQKMEMYRVLVGSCLEMEPDIVDGMLTKLIEAVDNCEE